MAADCKSALLRVRRFKSYLHHHPASLKLRRALAQEALLRTGVLRSPKGKAGLSFFSVCTFVMHYVYLLQSETHPEQRYTGSTEDLPKRLAQHNAGYSSHTAKFRPWRLVTYIAFENQGKAEAFEAYLKHGSGHAFAKKHLWKRVEAKILPSLVLLPLFFLK